MNINFKRKLIFVKVCSPFSFIRFEKAEKIFKKRSPREPILSPRFTSLRFTSPSFTSPPFTSPRFTSPRFTSPRLTSPVQSSPVHEMQYAPPSPSHQMKKYSLPSPPKKNYPPKEKAQSSPVQSLAQSSPESS